MSDENQRYLLNVFYAALDRAPSAVELENWSEKLLASSAFGVLEAILQSQEYRSKRKVRVAFYSGHYYSPVVDPSSVKKYVNEERQSLTNNIPGISIDREAMLDFWKRT